MEERAIAINIQHPHQLEEQVLEYARELEFLARTANIEVVESLFFKRRQIDPATYFTKGRLEMIEERIRELRPDLLLIDEELTPIQIRNLENRFQLRIMERTHLILYIFGRHARTAQAKLQVELAHYEYMLPRLTRLWAHLDRQRGGTGTRGGAGEKELETDRRVIKQRIAILKKKLKKIEVETQTRSKQRKQFVRVALVGYTNAGKSTLLNRLAKTQVEVANKLFSTLDTTVRKVVMDGVPFLLSDTVGFIRKLPPQLIESFKSTLAEAKDADILIHVVDVSNPFYVELIQVVEQTLSELDMMEKPIILAFNKIDLLEEAEIARLKRSWVAQMQRYPVFISAEKGKGLADLQLILLHLVTDLYRKRYPGLNQRFPWLQISSSDASNPDAQ